MTKKIKNSPFTPYFLVFLGIIIFFITLPASQEASEEYETISSEDCEICHETSQHNTVISEDLSKSVHNGLECLDCHIDRGTNPHQPDPDSPIGCQGCRACHDQAAEEYQAHGHAAIGEYEDMPQCKDCHGNHDILPSTQKESKTHPTNLLHTCGKCHGDLNLTKKYDILFDHAIEIYDNSVHGKATKEGVSLAATCSDCHSSDGSAHKIFSPGYAESTINHFNIPKTCGSCHKAIEQDFWDGIHGKLVKRGNTDSPVCTNCHGEHGIISPSDPRSPVSRSRVAETTCEPCHESIALTEKYGIPTGRVTSFIDTYHGLKSKTGDTHVANCASCHGFHRILPSSDPTSTIHPDKLQETCGDCHPGISPSLASTPIHGVNGEGLQTKAASIIQKIYIAAIIIIIGLMVIHWLVDLFRQIILVTKRPQVRRMRLGELWQHHLLMISFIALVITGFSLRYNESWITQLFFGWRRGFELRGIIHRVAAVVLSVTTIWHIIYLFTSRGKQFLKDMMPKISDFKEFFQKIRFNLGKSNKNPQFQRFSYIEKAEYWALIWGNAVMILTGILLWFDNFFIDFLSKGFLDVALVIHFYEAILASLAILIWHMYSTVFNPQIYPMNPSWLTGKMPRDMFKHEHPAAEIEEE